MLTPRASPAIPHCAAPIADADGHGSIIDAVRAAKPRTLRGRAAAQDAVSRGALSEGVEQLMQAALVSGQQCPQVAGCHRHRLVMLGQQLAGAHDPQVASLVTSQPGGQLIQRGSDHDLNALGSVGGPVRPGIAPDRPVRMF